MKKAALFPILIISLGILMLSFSACVKQNNNIEIPENSTIEEFEGEVTYYSKVACDPKNYILKIKNNDSIIVFCVVPTTKIVGGKTISVGDNVQIQNIKEDDNSTYREVVEIKILSSTTD